MQIRKLSLTDARGSIRAARASASGFQSERPTQGCGGADRFLDTQRLFPLFDLPDYLDQAAEVE